MILICWSALWPTTAWTQSGERILDFESRIEVHPDSSMSVTEKITVVSAGQQIKRGIYRDFPTTYKDRYGNTVRVGFDLVLVRRDGRREPFHTEQRSNGVRVYIGDRNVFLADGEHRYTLVYKTNRQLGFFEGFDELYWNVTGNGWAFPIERARAFVSLPAGAEVLDWAGFTGVQGARGSDFQRIETAEGVDFALGTTRRLQLGEGLTLAVAWPKGLVVEPSELEKLGYLLRDNADLAAGWGGLVLLLLYYLVAWHRFGRDPDRGTIIPEYQPPKGISPAAARYLMRTTFDDKAFTAAVMSLAVKGYLRIVEETAGDYLLYKTSGGRDPLSRGEKALFKALFGGSRYKIALEQENHETLSNAQTVLRSTLRTDFEKTYFLRNTGFFLPGLVLAAVAVAAAAFTSPHPLVVLGAAVFGVPVCLIGYIVWRGGVAAFRGELKSLGSKVGIVVPLLVLFAFLSVAPHSLIQNYQLVGLAKAVPIFGLIVLNLVFYHLLKAPTRLGRRVMDKIEGFELYLSVAEKDRMNLLNPPERTPELFEKFLPYALALDVEQAWSEQFADVLAAASQDPDRRRSDDRDWYSGRRDRSHRGRHFSSSLTNELSKAIVSASTPPGSASGTGGSSGGFSSGGFSGGGGGGGGGGGW